jgi:hypothetical protein
MNLKPLAKSPKPYVCRSPQCRKNPEGGVTLYILSQRDPCPRCGEKGYLSPLEIIHLIQESSLGGPIKGNSVFNNQCKTYEFLCESSHTGFQQPYRSPNHPKSYTLVPAAATCHDCLMVYGAKLVEATLIMK